MATRSRMMFLLKYFQTCTDVNHRATLAELQDAAAAEGLSLNPRAFNEDLEELNAAGFGIVTRRRGHFKTYYLEPLFSHRDLLRLTQLVNQSGSLTSAEKKKLLKKLMSCGSEYERILLEEAMEVQGEE